MVVQLNQSYLSPLLPIQSTPSPWSKQLITSVTIACLSSVQYGYHMSELNAPESIIKLSLSLNESQIGLITSIFSIGGLISSTIASNVSITYGLRISFIVTCIFYMIGSFIESQAKTYYEMLVGRFVSGIGGGFAIVFVPLYVNQISPVRLRGLLGSMTQVSVNMGILAAQSFAINWSDAENWRKILAVGWILGGITMISVVVLMEESPKWLILNNSDEEHGFSVLLELRNGDSEGARHEISIWKEEKRLHLLLVETNPGLKNLNFWKYLTDNNYRNSRIVATFSMIGQQFAGINSVIFYGVKILNGLFPNFSIMINCFISIGNMMITFIASLFLDKLGRKPMLLASVLIMGFACIGLSAGTLLNSSVLTIVSIFTYVGSFAIGCGPIPFLIVSEVSQVEVKDIAQSWATDCNWVSVFIIGSMFPILNTMIGGYVYLIFAVICFAFGLFVQQFVPETKGKNTYGEVWGIENRLD